MAAAVWTGYPRFFTSMTGFYPPHYGYSAYAVSVIPILAANPFLRLLAVAALLASGNRASWVGVLAGWAYLGGARRVTAGAFLCVLAVFGGLLFKPRQDNDSIRVHIWKAAAHEIKKSPWVGLRGVGFAAGVDGNAVFKAHSDVVQVAVQWGLPAAAGALLLAGLCLYFFPYGREKAALIALLTQSVVDNRLHHGACAVLLLAVVVAASRIGAPRLGQMKRQVIRVLPHRKVC
jgi:hypothetical protein